jgi:hypothetical protein
MFPSFASEKTEVHALETERNVLRVWCATAAYPYPSVGHLRYAQRLQPLDALQYSHSRPEAHYDPRHARNERLHPVAQQLVPVCLLVRAGVYIEKQL